jgi:hypothetical protein
MTDDETLITISAAARRLGIPPIRMRYHVDRLMLPTERVGNNRMISLTQVAKVQARLDMLKRRRGEAGAEE